MPAARVCPEFPQYRRLAAGQLSPPEREALLSHLEGCDACARLVEGLADRDTLVELIRQAQTRADRPESDTVARLVARLGQLPPGAPAAAEIRLVCSGCGKGLKIKADMAGKKAKCPHCQAVLAVPAASTAEPSSLTDAATLTPARPAPAGAATQAPPASHDADLCAFLAPAQAPDELGRLGPYRVLKILGAGGMGVVFKAEDPQLKRLVALKAMLPGLAASGSAKQRFLREAQAAAGLKHDHIVTIHQVGEDRGAPFLAMEFLEGEPLDERLKRQKKLPLPEVLRIGHQVACGLAAAHEKGLIHRDIKPANVWLEGKKGRVKILDFGLARASTDEAHLTQSGAIVGTPAYMAPEQAQSKEVGPRCDLFSLGCVLYRMATGKPPFRGGDLISTLMAVATENPATPRELDAALPPALSDLIMRLLAKEPAGRPASAQVVADALEHMAGQSGPTGKPALPGRSARALPPARPAGSPGKLRSNPNAAARPTAVSTKKRLSLSWLVGGGVLGMAVVVAAIVLFWQTPDGTVRIETDDPRVEIVFDKTGAMIKGASKEPIALRAGRHGIHIKRGDFTFESDKILIETGKTTTLRIEWLPGKMQLFQDGQVIGAGDVPLPKHFTNKLGMEFVLVPKGKSWLGGGGGKPGDREVEIAHDFFLGKYEVTQEEWEKVTGLRPSHFSRSGSGKEAVKKIPDEELQRFPAEGLSWADAQLFMGELNNRAKEDGWVYRLPKEAEWEYACRGGPMANKFDSAFDFYFEKPTNLVRPDQANFKHGKGLERTCKVGTYKPNRLGLHDMHGNVWEWCDDVYEAADGVSRRVLRGGGWRNTSDYCRGVPRIAHPPSYRCDDGGLRLARVPIGKEIVKIAPEEKKVAADAKLPTTFQNDLGMEFVLVPKGKSWLGGGGGKPGDREVEISHDFYLGKFEVTQGEWQKVMGTNPSQFARTGGDKESVKDISEQDLKRFPVENVSWEDCQVFIKRVNEQAKEEGWLYCLPKEAEWEYACRGGPLLDKLESAFDFYFQKPTNRLLPEQANFNHLKVSCKVGSYQPNRLGLYDMHGNVEEWCDDTAQAADGASRRVIRGGGWFHNSESCRAAHHWAHPPSFRINIIGLRLARVPVGKEIVKIVAEEKEPADPVTRDFEKLQGNWLLILYELNGKKMPEQRKDTLTIAGDKYRQIASGTGDILEATIKLDPTKKPKAVDAAISLGGAYEGKTLQGIYEIEDDQVKFCWAAPAKERPEDFASRPGSGDSLNIWKRVQPAQPQDGKGFVPLFNGKDATGWCETPGQSGTWTVEDGVLAIKAKEKQFAWFVTRRNYSNFHLFAEVMNIPGNNRAIAIRGSELKANGKASNYSISLGGVAGGQNLPIGCSRKMPDLAPEKANWQRPAFPVTVKPYAWFRMEIKAVGNRITIWVDGHKSLEFTDEGAFLRDGAITFWGVGPSEIRVRKLEIKELPAGDEGAVEPADQGFVPLFNGKDLTGWFVENGDRKQWKVIDGTIIASGHGLKSLNHLLSKRDYTDFVLRFDYRPIKAPWSSCVAFRSAVGEKARVKGQLVPFHPYLGLGLSGPQLPLPPGNLLYNHGKILPPARIVAIKARNEWNEVEMEIRSNTLRVVVNGEEVRRTNLDEVARLPDVLPGFKRASGRIGFAAFDGDVQYRNIRIKELPPDPKSVGPLPKTFTNTLGMEFVLVPKGKSWLGGGGGKPGDKEVVLAHDFYLGKYEVTQEEWQKVTGTNPSHFSTAGAGKDALKAIPEAELKRFPVEQVSWDDTQLFLKALNAREKEAGWVYRLPTEAEWEYACRGGPTTDKFESAFDFYLDKAANQLRADQANFEHGKGLKRPCQAGSYQPNRLGLFDMHGNVWEWCDDSQKGADGASLRVSRGGCWGDDADGCRAASRGALLPSHRNDRAGLRVARVAVGKKLVFASPAAEMKTNTPATGAAEPLDLLGMIDLDRHVLTGIWKREGKSITPTTDIYSVVQIPYVPPQEYILRVRAERTRGCNDILVAVVVAGSHRCQLVVDGWGGTISGISAVNGRFADRNATARRGRVFPPAGVAELAITVRKNRILLTADGKPVVNWQGNPATLSAGDPGLSDPHSLFLSVQRGGSYRIDAITLTTLVGQGQRLP
jgi:uncharacterized protein (TIGR03067 family)